MADGELERARRALASGDRATGRAHAERALRLARDAASLPTMGRALLLLGDLDEDLVRLDQAAAIFETLGEDGPAAEAHLLLAALLLETGRTEQARLHLGRAREQQARLPADPVPVAGLSARLHHLTAVAHRRDGRPDEAASAERQATLALTLVPDDELVRLRLDVARGRATDAVAARRLEEALEWHARSSALARRLADRPAELQAVSSLADDLASLGRIDDALLHHERALLLAQSLDDRPAASAVARRALALIDAAAPGDPRRQRFEAALADAGSAP